jgi:hypothetical protein
MRACAHAIAEICHQRMALNVKLWLYVVTCLPQAGIYFEIDDLQ